MLVQEGCCVASHILSRGNGGFPDLLHLLIPDVSRLGYKAHLRQVLHVHQVLCAPTHTDDICDVIAELPMVYQLYSRYKHLLGELLQSGLAVSIVILGL